MKITKKEIQRVIRTMDRTQIYRIAKLSGIDVTYKHSVYYFILYFAPTKRSFNQAYNIAYPTKRYYDGSVFMPIRHAIEYAKYQISNGTISTNYRKKLIVGNKNIYWCHPGYEHDDYNKWIAFPNNDKYRRVSYLINKYLGYESN